MSLNDLRRGQSGTITNVPDENLRIQLLRFGIINGTQVRCHCKLPFGPVVLKYGGQEIALGRDIARQVTIKAVL
jgi:ferrous iron transport protein A